MESKESTVSHRRGIALKETMFTISVLIYHRRGQRQNGIKETLTASVSEVIVKGKTTAVQQGLLRRIASGHICLHNHRNLLLSYLHHKTLHKIEHITFPLVILHQIIHLIILKKT